MDWRTDFPLLKTGARVVILGLNGRPELNGTHGIIISAVEDKGRFAVKLSSTNEKVLLLKPVNLVTALVESSLSDEHANVAEEEKSPRPVQSVFATRDLAQLILTCIPPRPRNGWLGLACTCRDLRDEARRCALRIEKDDLTKDSVLTKEQVVEFTEVFSLFAGDEGIISDLRLVPGMFRSLGSNHAHDSMLRLSTPAWRPRPSSQGCCASTLSCRTWKLNSERALLQTSARLSTPSITTATALSLRPGFAS